MTRPLSLLTTLLLLTPAILFAQEAEAVAQESLSLWGMIKQGGWAMYPLVFAHYRCFF
jgi:hypothetical protein